jgi:hypothetical protein
MPKSYKKVVKIVYEQAELVLLCTKCMKTETLIFKNHLTVGEKLRRCIEEHKKVPPDCIVDWDKMIAQNAVCYVSDVIKEHEE